MFVVPSINILSAPNLDVAKWRKRNFLYNMDFSSRFISRQFYPFGISTNPEKVIIGYDDWLYLGDQYAQTRTIDRRPPTEADIAISKQIGAATRAWDAYLTSKGVKLFRIMIGPNKSSIYPEYLPRWAKPVAPNTTDALLAEAGIQHYIDPRKSLLAAKVRQPETLYYKTDTHWNILGAAIAFRAFAQQISKDAPDLKWLPETVYELHHVGQRGGGDLASFLRLETDFTDSDPIVKALDLPLETTQYDFDSGQIIHQGGNPMVGPPIKPMLVESKDALNKKKVLWLRDSFGTAISPLMAATFSEVLQLHWSEAIKPGGRLIQLISQWRPDYVFFTVVERDSRSSFFSSYPPKIIAPKGENFYPIYTAARFASTHLMYEGSSNEYYISGNDPSIDFSFSHPIDPIKTPYLSIDLICTDDFRAVPLQLFWLEEGNLYFDEEHSTKFLFQTGRHVIDLRTIPKLGIAGEVNRLRLDIDAPGECMRFKLNNLTLGRSSESSTDNGIDTTIKR